MSSFLFFDPNGHHQQQPSVDPDIKFIPTMNGLNQSLANNNDLQRLVCVCGDNKSTIIQAIQDNPQVESIVPCKEHGGPETNPLFGCKVQDGTMFTPNTGYEFKGRLTLLKSSIKHGRDDQVLNELRKLRQIQKQSLSTVWQSVDVVEPEQNISSDTSDVHSKSKEAE